MATNGTIALIRFDEPSTDIRPSDAVGSLVDFKDTGAIATSIVDGFTGYARSFSAATLNGTILDALDVTPGNTLLTRDVTVDALLQWDFDGQVVQLGAVGVTAGCIMSRGIGGSAAEYTAYALDLRIVNQALRIGELRWRWWDTAGAEHVIAGGQFQVPSAASNGYILVTATRHWVSPTSVEVEYFVNDVLVGQQFITDGDIGGGTTGTFRIGGPAVAGAATYFVGQIDELRVRNYHVSPEEVQATWLRLSKWQPAGYTMIQRLLPKKAPVSDQPSSRVQRILRGTGHAFGYAMAQIENLRNNLMPDRAYGSALEDWERIVSEPARPADTFYARRRRVMGHWRSRQGSSVPGVQAALSQLLQTAPSQLSVRAYSQDQTDDFSAGLSLSRWWTLPAAQWTLSSGALRGQAASASDRRWTPALGAGMYVALMTAQGDGKGAHLLAKMTQNSALPTSGEVGLCFIDWPNGNYLLFGMRNNAGNFQLVVEPFVGNVSQGLTVLASGVSMSPIHLHMWQEISATTTLYNTPLTSVYHFEYAANRAGPYTQGSPATLVHRTAFQWAGLYIRGSTASLGAALDVSFDDVFLRSFFGDRPFHWLVYRDPALPGTPDLVGGRIAARRIAQAHTLAAVSSSLTCICGQGICGNNPIGV